MSTPATLELLERYATLGPDFVTWLGVHALRGDLAAPASEPALKVTLLGPLTMGASHGEATKMTLAGEEAGAAPEVDAALRNGKRLHRARFDFAVQDARWTFALDAETFDLRSVKLPVPRIPDPDEYMTMRLQSLQYLQRLVLELYEAFLAVRLDGTRWPAEVRGWLD